MVPFGGGGGGGENFNGGKLETLQGISNEISFKFFFEKKLKKNPQAAGLHDEGFSGLKRRINGGTNLYLGKEGERE